MLLCELAFATAIAATPPQRRQDLPLSVPAIYSALSTAGEASYSGASVGFMLADAAVDDDPFIAALQKMTRLTALPADWDSHGAAAPSELARRHAEAIVLAARRMYMPPVSVVPSAEGGIAVCFSTTPELHIDVECFNDGDIAAMVSRPLLEPEVWALGIDRLEATLERIAAELA